MPFDLSSIIFDTLKKKNSEYNAFVKKGDANSAKITAAEIAKLYKKLAEMNPATREQQLERSAKWDAISQGSSKIVQYESHGHALTSGKIKEAYDDDDNFLSQVDSLITETNVTWSDIGGLDSVKQLMQETFVISGIGKPQSIKPWKGVLLFGPPGTGKTIIAAATAGCLDATFYHVKSSRILSKYFGESSKMITSLYDSAREHSPSIVFVDEFDSLVPSRDNEPSEAAQMVLSTLLTELDGLSDKKSDKLILTLAATNTPWNCDDAILSRFPRRIYIPLPDAAACEAIIKIQTNDLDTSKVNLKEISQKCVDLLYSGRDLSNFCQQAMWNMVHDANKDLYKLSNIPYNDLKSKRLETRSLSTEDFESAWKHIKSPLTKATIERYEQWNEEFGGKNDEK